MRVGGRRVFVDERAERQARRTARSSAPATRRDTCRAVEIHVNRHVRPDRHELAALQRGRAVRDQRLRAASA